MTDIGLMDNIGRSRSNKRTTAICLVLFEMTSFLPSQITHYKLHERLYPHMGSCCATVKTQSR